MLFSDFTPPPLSYINESDFLSTYKSSTEDYLKSLKKTPISVVKNISVESLLNTGKALSTFQYKQTQTKKERLESYPSSYSVSQSEVPNKLISGSNSVKNDYSLHRLDSHKDLNMPGKKVKIQEDSLFDEFKASSKTLEISILNLLDTSYLDTNLLEKYCSETWLQSNDFQNKYNFWGEYDNAGMYSLQVLELYKDDFSNKYDDVTDKSYFFEAIFAPELETSPNLYQDQIVTTKLTKKYSTFQNLIEEAESPSTVDSPISQKDSCNSGLSGPQQIIKECLNGVTESDIQRLDPEVYLNDNIINCSLKLIEKCFISQERRKKCHFFNTYFMARMRKLFAEVNNDFSLFDTVYAKMEKWTKKINIFEKDFIFIPVNDNEHWNLLILCYPSKLFSKGEDLPFVVFLDSLSRMDNIYAAMLFQFFSRELKAKRPSETALAQYKIMRSRISSFPYFQHMVPKQSNYTDCGLYLLQYIEMFAEDENFILTSILDMNKQRWFPRQIIQQKRDDLKKIIQGLKVGQFGVITEYLQNRDHLVQACRHINGEYDSFNNIEFQKALNKTYGDTITSDQDRVCLMLDFYYFGTLDFNQAS